MEYFLMIWPPGIASEFMKFCALELYALVSYGVAKRCRQLSETQRTSAADIQRAIPEYY